MGVRYGYFETCSNRRSSDTTKHIDEVRSFETGYKRDILIIYEVKKRTQKVEGSKYIYKKNHSIFLQQTVQLLLQIKEDVL